MDETKKRHVASWRPYHYARRFLITRARFVVIVTGRPLRYARGLKNAFRTHVSAARSIEGGFWGGRDCRGGRRRVRTPGGIWLPSPIAPCEDRIYAFSVYRKYTLKAIIVDVGVLDNQRLFLLRVVYLQAPEHAYDVCERPPTDATTFGRRFTGFFFEYINREKKNTHFDLGFGLWLKNVFRPTSNRHWS